MTDLLDLVLLYGGKSGEHEVSQKSAASILANLDPTKYNIQPIGMGKDGCFYLNDLEEILTFKDSLPVRTSKSKLLSNLVVNGKAAIPIDVVFSIAHGPMYEDGCLQGVLQLAGIAYVGCDVLSSAIGMDKDVARRVACSDGIKCARYKTLSWHTTKDERVTFCESVAKELGWPLFVKPNSMGSSVGIHKVNNISELKNALADALRYDESVIVEEMIYGREVELAVLENKVPSRRPRVSVAGEIKVHHRDGFYSYRAKYLESNETELLIPAILDEALHARLQSIAQDIFVRLKCKGMARVDLFINDQTGEIGRA